MSSVKTAPLRSAIAPRAKREVAALEASAQAAARLLKLLASEQRLMLLCRLVEGEASVGELADHAGLAQSTASQHLAKLRADGLVATRREAQTVHYRLADPAAARIIDLLCDIYGSRRKGR
jgi:DNA-binding transcriptional ArsR family regulator